MSVKMTYSSELMDNYLQSESISPQSVFQSLQTQDGHSLLFSIGTDQVFYLIQEKSDSQTGWEQVDQSTTLSQYFGNATIVAKTFAVAQNITNGKIDIALAVTVNGNDYLYLSLGNSDSQLDWTSGIHWTAIPFDDAAHSISTLVIEDIYLAEASTNTPTEYPVVDVLRNPDDGSNVIFRYYIDLAKTITPGQYWNPHDVSADLTAGSISSAVGRKYQESVDGIYTFGSIGGTNELIYTPLFNVYDRHNPNAPASPSRLTVPANVTAFAVTASTSFTGCTDVFMAGAGALYYFSADNQHDGATSNRVFQNLLFNDVVNLFAYTSSDSVIVWGLNRAEQIFYTSCPKANIQDSSAWSYPLILLSGVEQVAPYVNRVNDGNTFFAHVGSNLLQKATQTPETTIWNFQPIKLPPLAPSEKASKVSSYTTLIQVLDENNNPVPNYAVPLASVFRCSVYINNRYYVLDKTPIPINTGPAGSITIVDIADNLSGNAYKVYQADGSYLSINPMNGPTQQIATLNTVDALSNAQIQSGTSNVPAQPLIDPNTSDDDKQAVVDSINQLSSISSTLPADGSVVSSSTSSAAALAAVPLENIMMFSVRPEGLSRVSPTLQLDSGLVDLSNTILVAAGDLVNWIVDTATEAYDYMIAAVEDVWHFIVTIEGIAYRFVINCIDKVISAIILVFNAIKTVLKDLYEFLKFLFSWDDFMRTKDVFKNIMVLNLNYGVDQLDNIKAFVDTEIQKLVQTIDNWAGVAPDTWASQLENGDEPMNYAQSTTDYSSLYTSPNMYLQSHFTTNVSNGQEQGVIGTVTDLAESLLEEIKTAFTEEADALQDMVDRIKSELLDDDKYKSMSLVEIIKTLTGIIADTILNSAQVLIDMVIDVLKSIATAAIELLDQPIWIPVLSDILEDIFGASINFSLLDIVCLVAAVPATIMYKVVKGEAPFSENDGFSSKIINATDVYALRAAFNSNPQQMMLATQPELGGLIDLDPADQQTLYVVSHFVSCVAGSISAVLSAVDNLSIKYKGVFTSAVTIDSLISLASMGVSALFAQPLSIVNKPMKFTRIGCVFLTIVAKIGFGIGAKKLKSEKSKTTALLVGSTVDAILAGVSILPSAWHFYELSKDESSSTRSLAIIDETSKLCNFLSRISSFATKLDKGTPTVKAVLSLTTAGLFLCYGLLQGSAGIYCLATDVTVLVEENA